jgi:Tol biopolymer transport system component/formylglycine-generating enzyme required for sulfatase activity
MSVPRSQDDLASLQWQLNEARKNLRLIEDRKAAYVLEVDVPLQLIKEEQQLRERIADLERTLAALTSASGSGSSTEADMAADLAAVETQPPISSTVRPDAAAAPPLEKPSENAGPAAETPPPVTPPAEPETGAVSPVRPDQRRLLIILYLVGLIGMAVITLLFFDRLRCLLEYRITPGIVALISLLASGIAVVVSLLVTPTLRHRLWSVYGGIATALVGGIIIALLLPTVSREFCSCAPAESCPDGTRTRAIDGMIQVYVPAGTFQMGSTTAEIRATFERCQQLDSTCTDNVYQNESPLHTVSIADFWLDRTEVTNAQYQLCVDSGQCSRSAFADSADLNQGDYPVVGVSWLDALHYCTWAGATLPTEAQWEYAARGKEQSTYPWGNEFDGAKLNFCDAICAEESNRNTLHHDGYAYTAPVTAFPNGASWTGALNLSGNVWEWTGDWYGPYSPGTQTDPGGPMTGTYKVIRGGSWINGELWTRAARRASPLPDEKGNSIVGLRCVSNTVPLATPALPILVPPVIDVTPTPEVPSSALSIVEPSAGNRVSYKTQVRGTGANLTADQQLWLLVQSYAGPDYFPQSAPISIKADGSWESTVWIGANEAVETGRIFTLTLALADAAASQTFKDAVNGSLAQLPAGAQIVQVVQVARTNPTITVLSHDSGDWVQGYEILTGTYADLEPGDWVLYAMVSTEPGRFTPFGPFKPATRTGEWQMTVSIPWPTTGRAVSFWLQPVLAGTDAAQRLESAVGKTLASDDLPPQTRGLYVQQARTEVARHERVAFASDRAGNDDIFIINADGTDLLRLTDHPAADLEPAWSWDGQRLAFVSRRDGDYQLYVMNVDDKEVQRVPIGDGYEPHLPAWSPDGEWIAFHSWHDGDLDIFKVHPAGTGLARLTAEPGRDENPVWSPDGQRVLFLSERAIDDAGKNELYVMDADGSNVTRLTRNELFEGYASWSPDGQRIIFVRDDGQNRDVYEMNADGSDIAPLANVDYDEHPTFAPDGRRYAFYSSVDRGQIYLAAVDGGQPSQLKTGQALSWSPAWSPVPGDERIAFAGRYKGDWDIYTMWENGSDITRLATPASNESEPRLSPNGHRVAFESDIDGDYEIWLEDAYQLSEWQQLTNNKANDWHPSWSPDGRKLAFTSDRDGNLDIYVMNDDGTGVVRLTTDPAHDDDPIWSADGQRIIFYSNRSGDGDLYEMNAADGSQVKPLVQGPGYDGQPAISPDDQVLIFASARDYPGSYATELYRLDLLSNKLTRLTDNENYDSIPLWSTNGGWLYFTSDRYYGNDDVWRMLPDGGDPQNLTPDDWDDTLGP